MAGITTSPQFRESPETAKVQSIEEAAEFACAFGAGDWARDMPAAINPANANKLNRKLNRNIFTLHSLFVISHSQPLRKKGVSDSLCVTAGRDSNIHDSEFTWEKAGDSLTFLWRELRGSIGGTGTAGVTGAKGFFAGRYS
jgi:hypothetical protein